MKTRNKKLLRIIMAIALNSITILALSQDTIHFRNGSSIISKVLEISPIEIKYKKIENVDSPVYIINKEDVKLIKYKNGSIDSFAEIKPWFKPAPQIEKQILKDKTAEPVKSSKITKQGRFYFLNKESYSESQILSEMKNANNAEINLHIRKSKLARGLQPVCFIGIPAAAIGFVSIAISQISFVSENNKKTENFGFTMLAFSGACLITSIGLKNYRIKHNEIALRIYNQTN